MSLQWQPTRRDVLRAGAAIAMTGFGAAGVRRAVAQEPAPSPLRVPQDASVQVLHPRDRVPASFIIDDSTCLVNMGSWCIPQFAAAWPENPIYNKPWKTWPREIPDAFVREFGEFCADHGVKGKYSIVPYPACVGWLDRGLPGWSQQELRDSLKLVRELMMPSWDIHPEMITHTRVIDLKTGRPLEPMNAATMENSYPQQKMSVDELAAYLAYALRILKNCELPCEGITTPGGFGNRVKPELPAAVGQAVRDVFPATEIPHYFKYIFEGKESMLPKLENESALVVNVPAGTGDWFGGWDGDRPSEGFRHANADASAGRMVELIERGEPAVMFCHWAGLYSHATKQGFEDFKRVILALEGRFRDRVQWMKVSEMARYQAARELTRIERTGNRITLSAPYACPRFTMRLAGTSGQPPRHGDERITAPLQDAAASWLDAGRWLAGDNRSATVCVDLPKGQSLLLV